MRTFKLSLVLAFAYFAAGRFGLMLPAFGPNITLVWLPTGIAVAALLRWGFGCWPGIALGAVAVNLAVGSAWPVALGIALGNTGGPVLAAWALLRLSFHPAFDRPRDILLLAAAAALGMLVSSGLGVATLTVFGRLPDEALGRAGFSWWAGDALGVVIAAPLILTSSLAEARAILRRRGEFAIWFAATSVATWGVFVFNRGAPGQALAIAFTPFPLLAWAALRFGPVGTSLGVILLSAGAAFGTATQGGPFHRSDPFQGVLLLWLFMATGVVLGWLISSLNTARWQSVGTQRVLEQALTDVSLGVLLAGMDRRITYANHGFTGLTGYTEAELLGKSCSLLHGSKTDPATVAKLKAAFQGDGHFDGEILNYRKDGTTFWNALIISPVRDERGAMTGFLGIQRDITLRKKAETALRESEDRFRKLIEHAPEAIQILDVTEGRFVDVNSASERLFKRSAAELRSIGPMELSPPLQPDGRPSREKGMEFIGRAMEGETPVFEWTHRDTEGRDISCEVRLLRLEIGGRAFVRGSVTDITERKQAEEALREREERLRAAMSASGTGTFRWNIRTNDLNWDEPLDLLFGLPPGQTIRSLENFIATVHPDDRPGVIERCEHCAREGTDFAMEFRVLWPDGSLHWLDDRGKTFADKAGQPLYMTGACVDITERKRAEEALRVSAEFTRSLIGSMQDGFSVLDADGVQSDANPAFCRMTGFSREALIGTRPPYPYWPPEELERIQSALNETINGRFADFELTFMRQNGERFPVIVSPSAVKNQDASVRSYCATVKDITDRKQAEQERTQLLHALQESQVRLQTLVTNLPGMAYRCLNDPNWTMSYVSEGCESVTGYRRDELESNRVAAYADLIHPDDRDRLWAKCQKSLDARTPCQNEYRIRDRHGRERWVSERASGVYAEDGALLAIDGFIQDITAARVAKLEREQLDLKVQETQKLESLGVLAGGIAHDFNNLLTSILGNASIAQLELPPGSPAQDCLEQINEASMRAADLCKQMLAYSGRGRFVVQTLDLGDLVEQTAQMLQISISKKAVLRYRLVKGLPAVEVDATQLRQVIMNLVINASEAIGDRSGVISLSTGLTRVDREYLRGALMAPDLPEGDYVFLEVSDSGCGMSPETQARIFDPFYTTKFTGRGLGLAAVLGIVRGHRGALKVYSELGRGTTFKLLFPAAAGAGASVETPPEVGPSSFSAGEVLVVDDEEAMRRTVSRMMVRLGLDPVLAADGREAVEVFRANPDRFKLVLLDLTMPHMDGEEAFTELRRIRPGVRVVLMSGFNAQEAQLRFSGKGLSSFLQKPFTIQGLSAVLQGVLRD